MIYNFPKVKKFLNFDNEGDFYYLQIIQRKKENPDLSKSEKVIKNYYIENLEYLERKQNEIIKLCDNFNARAYLRLNRRNYKDLTYRMNKLLAKYMHSKQYRATMTIWDKVCGRYHAEDNKLWIIDLDDIVGDEGKKDMGRLCFLINQLQPVDVETKVQAVLPSKNGFHIISTVFNVKRFNELIDKYDFQLDAQIHKDNPTNLYIP